MKPLFHPRLIHDPFGDPGLYVSLLFERRGLLFDMGDLRPLSARQLLKTSHAFITHAHMDHFIGFDQMLRVCLGREKELRLHFSAKYNGAGERLFRRYRRRSREGVRTWQLKRGISPND